MSTQTKYIISVVSGLLLYLIMFIALIYFNFIYYTTGFFAFIIFVFIASIIFRSLAYNNSKENDRPDFLYMTFIGSFGGPTLIPVIFLVLYLNIKKDVLDPHGIKHIFFIILC